jgi:hypothetical protein
VSLNTKRPTDTSELALLQIRQFWNWCNSYINNRKFMLQILFLKLQQVGSYLTTVWSNHGSQCYCCSFEVFKVLIFLNINQVFLSHFIDVRCTCLLTSKKKIVTVLTIYVGQKTRNQNMCFLQILKGFLQIDPPRASAAWQQSVQFSLNLMFKTNLFAHQDNFVSVPPI